MSISSRYTNKCPYCGKTAIESSRMPFGTTMLVNLICGHTIQAHHVQELSSRDKINEFRSSTQDSLYEFQKEGVIFAEQAGLRAIIGDEMGLGKTIQAIGCIHLHPEMCPILWVCKAGLKYQTMLELIKWLGMSHAPCVIENAREVLFPGFKIYMVSYDTFWRMDPEKFKMLGIRSLILDECQKINNPDSKRTMALRRFGKDVPYVLGLSGTPVKNRPDEFFVMLNMMRPERFPTLPFVVNRYFSTYYDSYARENKPNGDAQLKEMEKFQQDTEDFFIRRTVDQVMPDLPKIRRMYQHSEIKDKTLSKAYAEAEAEFSQWYEDQVLEGKDSGMEFYSCLLAYYARMRNLTALAKIEPCTEFVTDFLMSYDSKKITIFGHHKEALEILRDRIGSWCEAGAFARPLHLHSDLSPIERQQLVESFKTGPSRILIASTLASGEGLNLQFCSDAVMFERQWNPANEEQAEARFRRIGSVADRVNVTYMIAVGTIDEMMTAIVERKRAMMQAVLDGELVNWNESELMTELARHITEKRGGKKWA